MIDQDKLTSAVLLVGSLLVLWASFYYAYMPAVTAHFRQDLFEARRELFLLVVRGKIDPNNPAYVRVRMMCNGLLRFADRVDFSRLIGPAPAPPVPSWKSLLDQIDSPELRDELNELRSRVVFSALNFSVLRSPLLTIVVLVVVVISLVSSVVRLRENAVERATPAAEAISLAEA